jgi:hypothetical protein
MTEPLLSQELCFVAQFGIMMMGGGNVEGRNAGINNKANAAVLLVRMGHWRLQ